MNAEAPTGLEPYLPAISSMLRRLAAERIVARLWRRDASLWHPSAETQARIEERLGWLDLPLPPDPALDAWLQELQRKGYDNILYVANGPAGSIARLWERQPSAEARRPRLVLLDIIDAVRADEMLAQVNRERGALLFAANERSPEMMALCRLVFQRMEPGDRLRPEQLALITTPASPFDVWISGFRNPRRFALPVGVTERFGALSLLGAAPALLHGHDFGLFHAGATGMRSACQADGNLEHNPGVWLGTVLGVLAQQGRDKLVLLAPASLEPVAEWIATFVTGSLSKHRRGFVPILGEPQATLLPTSDRIFIQLSPSKSADSAMSRQVRMLEAAGQPVLRWTIPDDMALGATVAQWEVAVAVTGMIIGVNPFDEPDTVQFRQAIERRLASLPALARGLSPHDHELPRVLRRVLTAHPKPSYVALALYFAPTPLQLVAVNTLRLALAEKGYTTTIVHPLRDPLAATQLLHAGRPDGAIIAFSAERIVAGSGDRPDQALVVLSNARLQTDLTAWSRVRRAFLHLTLGSDAVAGLEACASALRYAL